MKFKKKPVIVEAFQFDGDLKNSKGEWYVPEWAVQAFQKGILFYGKEEPWELYVTTHRGDVHVECDDYVIQGIDGELYPCKPDIFNSTYEKVEEVNTQEVKNGNLFDGEQYIIRPEDC